MQQNTQSSPLTLPADHCFNHALLTERLQSFKSVRDKISLMLKRGEIVRIRRGLYARSRLYGGTVEPIAVANHIYGPSYISLEYALSYYGMIPEQVEVVTSVTPKRSRTFSTPLGNFSYEHLQLKAYSAGITINDINGTGVMIATREKALCDRIALAANIRTMAEIESYLFEDLRIDENNLTGMSMELLDDIATAYGMQRIQVFTRWYNNHFKSKGDAAQ